MPLELGSTKGTQTPRRAEPPSVEGERHSFGTRSLLEDRDALAVPGGSEPRTDLGCGQEDKLL